jgi:hypothetical protein
MPASIKVIHMGNEVKRAAWLFQVLHTIFVIAYFITFPSHSTFSPIKIPVEVRPVRKMTKTRMKHAELAVASRIELFLIQ